MILKFIADKLNYIPKIAKDHVASEWNGMTHSVRRQCYTEYLALMCVGVCVRLHDKQEYSECTHTLIARRLRVCICASMSMQR